MDHTAPVSLLLSAHLRELGSLRETVTRMTTKEEEDSVLDYDAALFKSKRCLASDRTDAGSGELLTQLTGGRFVF